MLRYGIETHNLWAAAGLVPELLPELSAGKKSEWWGRAARTDGDSVVGWCGS